MIDGNTLSGCDGCNGDLPGLAKTIRESCMFLISGHAGVRELYRTLAASAADDATRALFLEQAEKHDRMAKETAAVTLPVEEGGNGGIQDSKPGGS